MSDELRDRLAEALAESYNPAPGPAPVTEAHRRAAEAALRVFDSRGRLVGFSDSELELLAELLLSDHSAASGLEASALLADIQIERILRSG